MSQENMLQTPGLVPTWLLGTIGKLKLRLWGRTIDQLTGEVSGKSAGAAEAGMPLKCDPTALPLIGQDRLITQGPNEATATYRQRLRVAIDTWRQFAGNDWGVMLQALSQVIGLNGATAPRIRCVSNTGVWNWYEAGADTTQPPWHTVEAGGFPWDGLAPFGPDVTPTLAAAQGAWWRFWLVLESVGGAAFASQWPTLGTGGTPTLGNLTTASLGFHNVAPSFWTNLRTVLANFKAEHAALKWILVTFSSAVMLPGDASTQPDGHWGYGYKIVSGQYVATWAANVLPVPGPVEPMPFDENNVAHPEFGYRISGGLYTAI